MRPSSSTSRPLALPSWAQDGAGPAAGAVMSNDVAMLTWFDGAGATPTAKLAAPVDQSAGGTVSARVPVALRGCGVSEGQPVDDARRLANALGGTLGGR